MRVVTYPVKLIRFYVLYDRIPYLKDEDVLSDLGFKPNVSGWSKDVPEQDAPILAAALKTQGFEVEE